jgi:signal transduction histidine kinase
MGAATERLWLVAYTRARHECAVARQLESKDVAFLLPKFARTSRWSGCTQRVMAPLFPGYLGVMPRRLALVIRDISEAIRTRELLQEREVMATTGTLLAGAAHQAKNVIFGLSATLDAFEARNKNGPAEDVYFDNMRAGVARVQTLMRYLLDYASPAAREAQPVSMAAMVRSSASECQALAGKLRVELALDTSEDGDAVVHAARMVRALENLLENAIQHSKPKGTVTARLARTKLGGREMLRCDVIDQGPGFPPQHMERLFTPFFTLRPGGTGLGQTIAKRIVEEGPAGR